METQAPVRVVAPERFHVAEAPAPAEAPAAAGEWPTDKTPNYPGKWPNGICTASGSFEEAPCIPRGTCVLPERICEQESGFINKWNIGGSSASGKYQAMPSTWGGWGGYLFAAWAPEEVQDEWALALWDGGRGCSHWSAC